MRSDLGITRLNPISMKIVDKKTRMNFNAKKEPLPLVIYNGGSKSVNNPKLKKSLDQKLPDRSRPIYPISLLKNIVYKDK